jgi:quinol monooxygenase YgiN
MIVVAGWIRVAAEQRDAYLETCRGVVGAARAEPGCQDFSISPDLLDNQRINVFEQWESVEAVERFRGSGTPDDQQAMILDAHVVQHTVSVTTQLT